MGAVRIRDGIDWVGATDWEVREFHGYETPMGTTYNAYLVRDEKTALIDTAKAPFTEELLSHIREIIDPQEIDYLIVNHVEPDHSGALPTLAELLPNAEIITSPNGERGLRAYYPSLRDREMTIVKTGETLCTGKYTYQFVLMPMVHWPDSMSTYLVEEKILFSNDAFGQHIASKERFDDEIGYERLLERAGDYYANIVLPFGFQVKKLLGDVSPLPVELICPSHGVMLRKHIPELVDKYAFWANDGVDESRAVIVFETMWGATRDMAEQLAAELAREGVKAELYDLKDTHVSGCMAAALEAKYIYVGSPTLNRGMMPRVAAFLCYLKGLNPKGRIGRAFGAYGWSGESIGQVEQVLADMKYEIRPMVKAQWRP